MGASLDAIVLSLSNSRCSWQVRTLYSWTDVAQRTETVYDEAVNSPDQDLLQRLTRYQFVRMSK